MFRWLIGVLATAAAAAGLSGAAMAIREDSVMNQGRFTRENIRICAHRGGKALWPENTVLAYTESSKRFPKLLIEGDAQLTADGEVVLIHDDSVDRTTNGTGRVFQLTLAQIKELDAGYRFTTDGGATFPYRGQGITIPTFAEALAAVPGGLFLIEMKGGAQTPRIMAEVIRNARAEDRVILASFHEGLMQKLKQAAPEIATCFTYGKGMQMLRALREGNWNEYEPPHLLLALPDDIQKNLKLTRDEVAAIRAKGVLVQVHTVNDPAEMREFIELGVDSIISDHPDVLERVLAEAKVH